MTDEEMAEEYCNNEVPFDTTESGEKLYTENDLKYAFLAGLKAKIQWHTDSNDLPPMIQDERHISERVWINIKNWGTEEGHYDYCKKAWIVRCRIVNLDVVAWCEIPKFEEDK